MALVSGVLIREPQCRRDGKVGDLLASVGDGPRNTSRKQEMGKSL